MLGIVYIMIEHSWNCNYTATLSPEILHFQNFVVFIWGGGGGGGCPQTPHKGPKNFISSPHACVLGQTDLPFFIPTELTALKISHKICFNMSKQNEIKNFLESGRRANRVVIMNMGNSIALDLYRF